MAKKEEEYEPVYEFVQDSRMNSIIGYVIAVFLAGSAFHNLFRGQFAWFVLSLMVLALLVIPPLCYRDLKKLIPWEIVLIAVLPIFLNALQSSLSSTILKYIAVAATSLIIVVELHMFAEMEMADWFIVLFVTSSTIAVSGIWAVIRWLLGPKTFVPIKTHPALMTEFMSATLAGILFGLLYKFYLRHKKRFKEVS